MNNTREIRIGKKLHIIKRLEPLDFIEHDILPFSLFTTDQQTSTAYDRIMAELNKKTTPVNIQKRMELIAVILSKGVITPNMKGEQILATDVPTAVRLYAEILDYSFPNFRKVYKVSRNNAIFIDKMAQRYGKTPATIEFGVACNPIEALMFNSFIFSVGVTHDIEAQKASADVFKGRN